MSNRKRKFDEKFGEPQLLDWDFKTTHALSKRRYPEIEQAKAEFEDYFGYPVQAAQISTIFLRYGFVSEEYSHLGVPGVDGAWIVSCSGCEAWHFDQKAGHGSK